MKIAAEVLPSTLVADKSRAAVFADLVKARLTMLVLLTTFVGFYVGWRGPMNFGLMFHTLVGTALLAAGASALNQLLEREYDAKMRRTQDRPLPSGRLQPATVVIFGGGERVGGLIYLALAVNLLTSVVGAVTFVSYLFIYTPLKRVTWLNTADRRDSRGAAAVDGLDGGARRIERRGLGAVCDPGVLADAALHGHRLDLSRRIREGRLQDAAGDDPDGRRTAQQAVELRAGVAAGEPVSVRFQNGRTRFISPPRWSWARDFWVRHPVFAATHAGARAATVFGVHYLSAAAAGGDGVGQGEVKMTNS